MLATVSATIIPFQQVFLCEDHIAIRIKIHILSFYQFAHVKIMWVKILVICKKLRR